MTQSFQSSKYLIAKGPVNWYDPAAQDVERKNKDLDRSVSEKQAQTNQKLQVLKEEDPIRAFAQFSQTVAAGVQLANKIKAHQEGQDSDAQQKVLDLANRYNISDDDIAVIAETIRGREEYDLPRNKIFSDDNKKFVALEEHFKGEEYKGLLDELRNLSPRMLTQMQEYTSIREAQRLGGDIHAYENSPEWKQRYDPTYDKENWKGETAKDYNNKAPDKQNLEHKAWIHDKISSMGNSDELTRRYMSPELQRASSTRKNIGLAKQSIKVKAKNLALAESWGLTYATSLNSFDFPRYIHDQIIQRSESIVKGSGGKQDTETAMQIAAEQVRQEVRQLNRAGYIPQLALTDLENYLFDHPAGKDGKSNLSNAFFKGEGDFFKEVIQDNIIGGKRYLAVQAAMDTKAAESLSARAETGDITREELDTAILTLKGRGNLDAKVITALERLNPDIQSKAQIEVENESWDETFTSGRSTLFTSEIAGFSQNSVKVSAGKQTEEYNKFLRDIRIDLDQPEKGSDSDDWAENLVAKELGIKLDPLDSLETGTQTIAQNIISRIRDQEKAKQFLVARQAGTLKDPAHASIINNNVTNRLRDLGFYHKEGVPTSGPEGPLTPKITEKSFPGLKDYDTNVAQGYLEATTGSTYDTTLQDVERAISSLNGKKSLNSINTLLEMPNTLVKNNEFLGVLRNFDPETNTVSKWPPDLVIKGDMMNIPPSVLTAKTYFALLNSQDEGNKNFVQLHQLDNSELKGYLEGILKADTEFKQTLKDANDPYLPTNTNPRTLTDSQMKRLAVIKGNVNKLSDRDQLVNDIREDNPNLDDRGVLKKLKENRNIKAAQDKIVNSGYNNLTPDELKARILEEINKDPKDWSLPKKFYKPFQTKK